MFRQFTVYRISSEVINFLKLLQTEHVDFPARKVNVMPTIVGILTFISWVNDWL